MTKVLLVEDDNNLREIYEARLAAEGYDIATAKDGEDALAVAKQEKPELIISDVMMPRISGFEMLDILRNTDELKNTKVIMLTALGQSEDKSRADNLGADRYLVKSQVTLEDIVKAAQELLNPTPDTPPVAEPEQQTPPQDTPTPTPEPAAPVEPSTPPATDTPTPTPITVVDAPADPAAGQTDNPAEETPTNTAVSTSTAPEPEPAAAAPIVEPTTASNDNIPKPMYATPAEPVEPTTTVDDAVTPAPAELEIEAPDVIQMPQTVADPDVAALAETVQSTLQESNDVEQKIKDFEASDATPPPAEPQEATETASTAPAPETTIPETAPTIDTPTAAPATDAPQPQTFQPSVTAPKPEQPAETPPVPTPGVSQISGKLVIQPPTDHANEPDISALVAQEEYQEQTAAGLAGQPVASPAPDVPANPTPEEDAKAPEPGGVFIPNNDGSAHDTAL